LLVELTTLIIKTGVENHDFLGDFDRIRLCDYDFLKYDCLENVVVPDDPILGEKRTGARKTLIAPPDSSRSRRQTNSFDEGFLDYDPASLSSEADRVLFALLPKRRIILKTGLLTYNDLFRLPSLKHIKLFDNRKLPKYFLGYLFDFHPIATTFLKTSYFQKVSVKVLNFFLINYFTLFYLALVYSSQHTDEEINVFGNDTSLVRTKVGTVVTVLFLAKLTVVVLNLLVYLPFELRVQLNEGLSSDMVSCFINRKTIFRDDFVVGLHLVYYVVNGFFHFLVCSYIVNFCGFYDKHCATYVVDGLIALVVSLFVTFVFAMVATVSRVLAFNSR
jgi:hypothetical protein